MHRWLVLILFACAATAATAAELPAPVRALQARGVHIHGGMSAPPDFRGFLGEYRGQPVPVYLLPDGRHVVIGSLYGARGHDLTHAAFARARAAAAALPADTGRRLAASRWIAEGAHHARRVVYVFTDTECVYCHRLWLQLQPLLAQGAVQVRYVLVAVIDGHSLGRAAALLSAPDPATAMRRHEADFGRSPIAPMTDPPPPLRRAIEADGALMTRLGGYATPTIVYRDRDGHWQLLTGLPHDPARLRAIFGT